MKYRLSVVSKYTYQFRFRQR